MLGNNLILINIDSTRDPEKWLQKYRNYDVGFIAYKREPAFIERIKDLGCYVWAFDGSNKGKWGNINFVLRGMTELYIQKYKTFWFPDPDLECLFRISDFFDFVNTRDLGICQPSLTRDSICSHSTTKNLGSDVRETFTEIMCPCFSREALIRNIWTFELNFSGYGIDCIWNKHEKTHVVDRFQVRHAEKPHFEDTARLMGFPDPMEEFKEIQLKYLGGLK